MRTAIKARAAALAAAAAIATTGVLAASGVADAATAQPAGRVATALSIRSSTPVAVHHHTFAKIAGQLTAGTSPVRFKLVWLERQGPKGHWFIVRRERTGVHGWVGFRILERATTNFRLFFHGTPNFKPAVSSVVTITAAS